MAGVAACGSATGGMHFGRELPVFIDKGSGLQLVTPVRGICFRACQVPVAVPGTAGTRWFAVWPGWLECSTGIPGRCLAMCSASSGQAGIIIPGFHPCGRNIARGLWSCAAGIAGFDVDPGTVMPVHEADMPLLPGGVEDPEQARYR